MSISDAQVKVRAFHEKFGCPSPSTPQEPCDIDQESHGRRLTWIEDELNEGRDSFEFDDDEEFRAELADSYVDIIYFALGGLVELGIDGGPLFDEVHRKNMEKVKLPGVEKIAKPKNWTPPDIAALIEQQRNRK